MSGVAWTIFAYTVTSAGAAIIDRAYVRTRWQHFATAQALVGIFMLAFILSVQP